MSTNAPTPPEVLIPPAPKSDSQARPEAPEPQAPPVCTPEQEANGTCRPPARSPETPSES